MPRRQSLPCLLVLASMLALANPVAGPALAQPMAPGAATPPSAAPPPAAPPPTGPAARRLPQPVRAGELTGRRLLRPIERQDLLGRVASVARQPDGALVAVVRTGGVSGLGTHLVAVPLDATALLGEHLALMDITPEALRALPSFDPASAPALAPDQVVRVGLVRPFH